MSILRKIDLWPAITRSNVDLGSQKLPSSYSTRRGASARFFREALRPSVSKLQGVAPTPQPLLSDANAYKNCLYCNFAQKRAAVVNWTSICILSGISGSWKVRVGRCCLLCISKWIHTAAAFPRFWNGFAKPPQYKGGFTFSKKLGVGNTRKSTDFLVVVIMHGFALPIIHCGHLNPWNKNGDQR